ncbi:SH3 domain-containing protein [Rhizobium leguminosarum]|uniref:phage tail tip lysozyme n=1 Tax=Rhizobium leguminosarum TaxID=384 RepID=UPI001C94DC9A|nr:phage tail tip lysozyme [Rhizobium leguminosarum]MBY5551193.1 SH3 domain-containing protein [Rhizobium leguminosarum]MBY5645343.1 SH3 domain-containing protein [Rhizobium leguminosarum]
MAVMKVARVLRDKPSLDAAIIRSVPSGTKVTVLDDKKLPFTEILIDATGEKGWVVDEAIDKTRDTVGPLDKLLVAAECVELAANYGGNAYYLMTIAQMRTNIIDAQGPQTSGLFAFTNEEWILNANHPEYEIAYSLSELSDWRAQCTLFAIMAAQTADALSDALATNVSMVQLLLAQTIGLLAARQAIGNDGQNAAALIAGIAPAQAQTDRIDLANLANRDATLLKGSTVNDMLATIEAKLNESFASVDVIMSEQVELFIKKLRQLTDLAPTIVGDINFSSPKILRSREPMARKIAERFASRGYGTLQQIAAIANAIQESNLNPSSTNLRGERSFGLFQLNQNGGVGTGHSDAELLDPDRNIEIMLDEIQKPYLKKSRARFLATANLHEAVEIFVFNFEKPADKPGETQKRFKIAQTLIA